MLFRSHLPVTTGQRAVPKYNFYEHHLGTQAEIHDGAEALERGCGKFFSPRVTVDGLNLGNGKALQQNLDQVVL